MTDEELETAAYRTFLVKISPRAGYKKTFEKMIVVKAHSISKAKIEAAKKAAKGEHKFKTFKDWVFPSVEEVKSE